jgi:hypothetical protein
LGDLDDSGGVLLGDGYVPPEKHLTVWRISNHARKRVLRDKNPQRAHGHFRETVTAPMIPIQCYRCLQDNIIDIHRLGGGR